MKVIIVGGVAGGASAAARLRRLDEDMEIIMIERSGYISYANCGLPYYIGGSIQDKEELTLQTPESFYQRFNIDVRILQEVIDINTQEKIVSIKNLKTNTEYQESYDKLILAPGAKAIVPAIEGINNTNVFSLRTVEDTFSIDQHIKTKEVKKAVVVGAGFIGLEMAENLKERGIEVTIVQLTKQVLAPLDQDMAAILHNCIRHRGIDLLLNTEVTKIVEKENKTYVILNTNEALQCDLIIMAIGVQPDSTLTTSTDIELGLKGAIKVNEHMQTNVTDIYAIGDVVEVTHYVTKKPAVISLAGPANKQGRIVANHICGIPSSYKGSQGSSILKMFDVHVATTGINEKEAKEANIDYDYVVITSASHATYYPGAKTMFIKVLFEKNKGRILGGQIVGFEGVDKRIDVLAMAIRAKMTAFDLTELDLAYAPPFSSAKDPMNMVGYVIENILLDKVQQVHWSEIENMPSNIQIIDTRTIQEYTQGHIKGSLHIPIDELRNRSKEISHDKEIYVYCQSGLRSYLACRILVQNGFTCKNISGGYVLYENIKANKEIEKERMKPCNA